MSTQRCRHTISIQGTNAHTWPGDHAVHPARLEPSPHLCSLAPHLHRPGPPLAASALPTRPPQDPHSVLAPPSVRLGLRSQPAPRSPAYPVRRCRTRPWSPAPPPREPALPLASLLERASPCTLTNGIAGAVSRPRAVRRDKPSGSAGPGPVTRHVALQWAAAWRPPEAQLSVRLGQARGGKKGGEGAG